MPSLSHRQQLFVFCVALPLGASLLYAPGLYGPFLFDDAPNILDNTQLLMAKDGLLDWWTAAQSSASGSLRRPLSVLSFALQSPGPEAASAFAFKAVNLGIHLVCAALVYLLVLGLTNIDKPGSPSNPWHWMPLLAAALWLLNPLLLSTVLYVVQRMAQLATLFTLAGLVIYLRTRSQWMLRIPGADEVLALLLWVVLFTSLAVLSKENGVLLPVLLLVLEISVFRCALAQLSPSQSKVALRGLLVVMVVALAGVLASQWHWIVAGYQYRDFTLAERLLTQLRVMWSYVNWFTLPGIGQYGLFHDDIPVSKGLFDPWTTALAAFSWVFVLVLAVLGRHKFPWLLAGVLLFIVGHSMESSVLALEMVFEHRNYLPSVGLAIVIAGALSTAMNALKKSGVGRLRFLPAIALLLLFAFTLGLRANIWSSESRLANAMYVHHPASPRSASFYANSLIRESGQPQLPPARAWELLSIARHEFEALYQRNPKDLSALVMLYTMDSQHFTELGEPARWLPEIERVVAASVADATEYAAMRVLMKCVDSQICAIEENRLHRLVDLFASRYLYVGPATELKLWRAEQSEVPVSDRIHLLEEALERSPGSLGLYYDLIRNHLELGNYAAAHEVIVELLRADPQRRQLSAVNKLFAA